MKTAKIGLLLILIGLIAVGCAPSMSGSAYSRDQARKVQTVHEGEVIMVREVLIEGTKSEVRVKVWPGLPAQSLVPRQAVL
jgi:outer membrane lipoprotein SlyB